MTDQDAVLAEGTVKLHIAHAFKRLGVGNRVGLARIIAASPARRAEAGSAKRGTGESRD